MTITKSDGLRCRGGERAWKVELRASGANLVDTHIIMLDIPNHPGCAIFGVFDGHGGPETAKFLADRMGESIAELPDMFDEKGNRKIQTKINEQALTTLCIDLDEEYLKSVGGTESLKNQGSTAVVTIAKKLANGNYKILNINVGDSRIVLGRKIASDRYVKLQPFLTFRYEAVSCTNDHNGHSRTERKRVREAGNRN